MYGNWLDNCPECTRRGTAPTSIKRPSRNTVTCRYKCACGHTWTASVTVTTVEDTAAGGHP